MAKRDSTGSPKPWLNVADDLGLTPKEMLSIVKAITAWNGGTLEFDQKYLSYANELPMKVERRDGIIKVMTP